MVAALRVLAIYGEGRAPDRAPGRSWSGAQGSGTHQPCTVLPQDARQPANVRATWLLVSVLPEGCGLDVVSLSTRAFAATGGLL